LFNTWERWKINFNGYIHIVEDGLIKGTDANVLGSDVALYRMAAGNRKLMYLDKTPMVIFTLPKCMFRDAAFYRK